MLNLNYSMLRNANSRTILFFLRRKKKTPQNSMCLSFVGGVSNEKKIIIFRNYQMIQKHTDVKKSIWISENHTCGRIALFSQGVPYPRLKRKSAAKEKTNERLKFHFSTQDLP